MRIGLLGGSFNPAHAGHLHITRMALARAALDRAWWLITPANPLKDRAALADLDARVETARQVARDPRITVTAFEAARGFSHSIDTILFLLRAFPGTHFVWLMGADNLATLHLWRRWRQIVGSLPLVIVDRPGARFAALNSRAARHFRRHRWSERDAAAIATAPPPAWTLLHGPLSPLSSSAIRAAGG